MSVFLSLASGYAVCLMLVWAIEAVRRGRSMYWPAVVGLSLHLLARLGDGYMLPFVVEVLRWGGLVVPAFVLIIDILTEEVPVEEIPAPSATA